MNDWNKTQQKRFAPLIADAFKNLETKLRERLIALREGTDSHNRNFPGTRVSQRTLSEILEILPQNYNRIEIGKMNKGNDLTLRQAMKLAVFYGTSVDYIATGKDFFGAPNAPKPSHDQNELLKLLKESLESEKELNRRLAKDNKSLEAQVEELKDKLKKRRG